MPSECQQFEDYLLEDEESLSAPQREGLSRHLAGCECCREERELFLDSWNVLDAMEPELAPSSMLRAKVWEKIREEETQPKPLVSAEKVSHWKKVTLRIGAAAAALFLGFSLGRGIRGPIPVPAGVLAVESIESSEQSQRLDPALIELASQEGFSVEIFPETTEFSPLDEEMVSALAPSQDAEEWLNKDRKVAVPVRFISQGDSPRRPR